ncbi:MAG: tRNA pseudouridine(55) synthase TruB [Clostridia bacterium]|nr:tRNA pseudouridine(55) synthase TruB [Clostridia bacterium]
MNGILIIDKPQDYTSFDVVAVVRGCVRERKAGHTGTLDPMATGVLPILLGTATKVQSLLPDTDKEYEAFFRLGLTTDTLDITGKVLHETTACHTSADIEALLPQFRGDILQKPPMYSAVYKNGVRLYELARQGIETEREARPVHISRLELLQFDEATQSGRLQVICSKGTYIRSLCDDIGQQLGCGGVLTALRRVRACGYTIAQATPLAEIRRLAREGQEAFIPLLRPVDSVFAEFPCVRVSEKQAQRFRNGAPLLLSRLKSLSTPVQQTFYRVYAPDGCFLGIGEPSMATEELLVKKLFDKN